MADTVSPPPGTARPDILLLDAGHFDSLMTQAAGVGPVANRKGVNLTAYSDLQAQVQSLGSDITRIATYAAMRLYSGTALTVFIDSKSLTGDGGYGVFYYDPSDTVSADNDATILVDALNRRWKRNLKTLDIRQFGARPSPADSAAAVQAAIIVAEMAGYEVFIPEGLWYWSQRVKTKHTNSYYRMDTGVRIFGAGQSSRVTRGQSLASDVVDYSNESTWATNCAIAVHGSNNIIEDIQFQDCANPLFFGQDPSVLGEDSHTSFNRLKNIWIRDCGTGLLSAVALGCYYNTFEDMHVFQTQIGMHFRKGARWASSLPNNNRNTFKNVRVARSYVGLMMENGDTNQILGFHCEGNSGAPPTNNRYAFPATATAAGMVAPTGHFFGSESGNNFSFGCTMEACDVTLNNNGVLNTFIGLYRENEAGKVLMNTLPALYISRDANLFGTKSAYLANTLPGAYSAIPAGVDYVGVPQHLASSTLREANSGKDLSVTRWLPIGAFASGENKVITLQDGTNIPSNINASGSISVQLVGECGASNLAFSKKFDVVYRRNAARTIVRAYLFNEVNGRATGVGAGDATEPFAVSVAASGTTLQLSITAPARVFERVDLHVTEYRVAQ